MNNQTQTTEDFNCLEVSYKDTAHETIEQMDPLIEFVKVETIDDSVALSSILPEDNMGELLSDELMRELENRSTAEVDNSAHMPLKLSNHFRTLQSRQIKILNNFVAKPLNMI